MRCSTTLLGSTLLSLTGLACTPTDQQQPVADEVVSMEAEVEAIRTVHEQFIAAWNAGDLEAILDFYADDIVSVPPNVAAWVGKETIRSVYELVGELYRSELPSTMLPFALSGGSRWTRCMLKSVPNGCCHLLADLTGSRGGRAVTRTGCRGDFRSPPFLDLCR